jgi:hypothetical protein
MQPAFAALHALNGFRKNGARFSFLILVSLLSALLLGAVGSVGEAQAVPVDMPDSP